MCTTYPKSAAIVAPPPVLYIGAFVVGCAIHLVTPQPIFSTTTILQILGVVSIVLSGVFARWTFIIMRNAGTSPDPRKQSTVLVTNGPFCLSRNPIYLAMSGLYIGPTLILNSIWLIVLLAPLLFIMHWGVILREEGYLSQQFGEPYLKYKRSTRRWL